MVDLLWNRHLLLTIKNPLNVKDLNIGSFRQLDLVNVFLGQAIHFSVGLDEVLSLLPGEFVTYVYKNLVPLP